MLAAEVGDAAVKIEAALFRAGFDFLLEMLPKMFTIVLVGRVGYGVGDDEMQKLHLDAASLAVMFTNVAAMAPAIGEAIHVSSWCFVR